NFYLIVPLEYQDQGIIPTSWYIDPFMKYLSVPYYVSLLTGASLLGFAHQQPQSFQVVVKERVRLRKKNTKMLYFAKRIGVSESDFIKQKCHTGYFNIATK